MFFAHLRSRCRRSTQIHSHSYANFTLLDCSIPFVATLPYSHHIESYFTFGCVYTFSDGFAPFLLRFFRWISQTTWWRQWWVEPRVDMCSALSFSSFFRPTLTFGDDLAWQKLKYSAFNINKKKFQSESDCWSTWEMFQYVDDVDLGGIEQSSQMSWGERRNVSRKTGQRDSCWSANEKIGKKMLRENWFYSHRRVCNKRDKSKNPNQQPQVSMSEWDIHMKRQWKLIDMKYVTNTVVRANWSTQAVAQSIKWKILVRKFMTLL